jgi:ATP-dependent Clp protease, protease subunit
MSQPKSRTFYLNYFDNINEPKVKALMTICSEIIVKNKPDVLYFLFASGGGLVNAGVALHNFLRSLPAEIVMHNTGAIDSIATLVFLAGKKRYAAPHSSFLFHGITSDFTTPVSLTRSQLTENLSTLKLAESKIADIYVERSKLTLAEVDALFVQGDNKDLTFALDKGIIQKIRIPSIPKGAPFLSVNLG